MQIFLIVKKYQLHDSQFIKKLLKYFIWAKAWFFPKYCCLADCVQLLRKWPRMVFNSTSKWRIFRMVAFFASWVEISLLGFEPGQPRPLVSLVFILSHRACNLVVTDIVELSSCHKGGIGAVVFTLPGKVKPLSYVLFGKYILVKYTVVFLCYP